MCHSLDGLSSDTGALYGAELRNPRPKLYQGLLWLIVYQAVIKCSIFYRYYKTY